MENSLENIVKQAQKELADASSLSVVEEIRVTYLGKKGVFTRQMKTLGKLSAEERPKVGAVINQAKQEFQAHLEQRKVQLENELLAKRLIEETIDVTLPGRGP